jgi:hypothetical protein
MVLTSAKMGRRSHGVGNPGRCIWRYFGTVSALYSCLIQVKRPPYPYFLLRRAERTPAVEAVPSMSPAVPHRSKECRDHQPTRHGAIGRPSALFGSAARIVCLRGGIDSNAERDGAAATSSPRGEGLASSRAVTRFGSFVVGSSPPPVIAEEGECSLSGCRPSELHRLSRPLPICDEIPNMEKAKTEMSEQMFQFQLA